MFAVGELATMAQEQLAVTVLVVDDGGYGMLRFGHQHANEGVPGTDLVTPGLRRAGRRLWYRGHPCAAKSVPRSSGRFVRP